MAESIKWMADSIKVSASGIVVNECKRLQNARIPLLVTNPYTDGYNVDHAEDLARVLVDTGALSKEERRRYVRYAAVTTKHAKAPLINVYECTQKHKRKTSLKT